MYHLYFFISQSATASWSEPLSSVRSFPSPLQDISPDFHPPLTSTRSCSSANLSEKSRMETQQVRLSVQYPSKSLNKNVGKALAHGVPSRIATAVMNCLPVRNQSFSRLLLLLLSLSLLLIFCCSKSTEKQNCFFFFSNADWNAHCHIPFYSVGYPLPIQQADVCKFKPPNFENSGYFGWKPWQLFKADMRGLQRKMKDCTSLKKRSRV